MEQLFKMLLYYFDALQAIAEKEKGNELYKQKKFEEALTHYDKAIELDPTEMLFLTNKAGIIIFNVYKQLFVFLV